MKDGLWGNREVLDITQRLNETVTIDSKKRLTELDFMRIAGFVMVVAQHILGSYAGRPTTYLGPALFFHVPYLFGRPAVPMFVALTAFTLFNSNYGKPFVAKTFFGKKMINIVLPYLFWSFFYMFFYHKDKLLQELGPVLITGQGSYHLWYVGMVVRIYILFPLVLFAVYKVMQKNQKDGKWLLLLAFVAFYGFNYWNGWITSHIANYLGNGVKNFYVVRFLNYSPLYYCGYFAMGALYYFQKEKVKAWVKKYWGWLALLYVPISVYMYILQSLKLMPPSIKGMRNMLTPRLLFMCITIILLLRLGIFISEKAQAHKWEKWIISLGKLSFGAYLVHVLMLNTLANLYLRFFNANGNLIIGLVVFSLAIVLSFLIAFILDKIPFGGYLVGTGKIRKTKRNMV